MKIAVLFLVLLMAGCAGRGNRQGDIDALLMKQALEQKAAEEKPEPNHLELARRLVAKGFYDVALVQLKEAEKKDGKNPEIFYLKGVCYREKKGYKKAISQFNRALEIDPEYSYACNGMGITYDLTGDHQKALEFYQKAIDFNPANAGFHNNLGFSQMALGRLSDAIENFKKSIALNPDFRQAINNLGIAYGLSGRYEDAFSMFKKGGSRAAACNNMGFIYQMKGEMNKAIEMYQKAIALDPDLAEAKTNLKAMGSGK